MSMYIGTVRLPRLRYARIGLNLLVLFWILNALIPTAGISFQKLIIGSLFILAVFFLFIASISSKSFLRTGSGGRLSLWLVVSLLVWGLVTILRGVTLEGEKLLTLVANPEVGGLVWLLPFAAFIGAKSRVLESLLRTFNLHTVVGVALCCWVILGVSGSAANSGVARICTLLLYSSPIVLICGLGRRSDRAIHWVGIFFGLIAYYLIGLRSGIVIQLVLIIFVIFLGKSQKRHIVWAKAVMSVALISMCVVWIVTSLYSRMDPMWIQDTRTFLWEELRDDFTGIDWLIGRGALGTYFSPYFAYHGRLFEDGDWMYRQVNEIGYLHILLKGGFVGVLAYVLVMIRAFYCSLRLSSDRLHLGISLLLAMHLAELAIAGQAIFSPYRVLIWVLAGIAMQNYARQQSMKR